MRTGRGSMRDTYRSTAGSVLGSSPSNIGNLVIFHNFIIAVIQSEDWKALAGVDHTNIPACSSPAKIASLALSPYFSNSFSPPVTWRSRRGFPKQKTE